MENPVIETVVKRRSYRSCINAAWTATRHSAWSITKKSWWVFLLISLIKSVIEVWGSHLQNGFLFVGFNIKVTESVICLLSIIIVNTILWAYAFAGINKRKVSWNILRQLKTWGIYIAALVVYALLTFVSIYAWLLICQPKEDIPLLNVIPIAMGVGVVMIIFLVPLIYVIGGYLTNPDSRLYKPFMRNYVAGFRSWTFLFITLFSTLLCVVIADAVLCLPAHVLTVAQLLSAYGTAAFADPSGLPASFPMLQVGILFVANIIRIYFVLFIARTVVYAYGNVKRKAEELKNLN